jgi:glycyl-tRNA synthetase
MNPQTWVASGHLGGFSDPLMDCKECKTRHRADNLIEDFDGTNVAGWSNEQMTDYINEKGIVCPNCGKPIAPCNLCGGNCVTPCPLGCN